MKESPITYNAEMIRAKKEKRKTETRKTETRRILHVPESACIDAETIAEDLPYYLACKWCPYGVVGDRLWSRESYCIEGFDESYEGRSDAVHLCGHYLADGEKFGVLLDPRESALFKEWKRKTGNIAAMYQFRSLSRFLDEITNIRVQRVQEITGDEVVSEGVRIPVVTRDGQDWPVFRISGKFIPSTYWPEKWETLKHRADVEDHLLRGEYASLWDSINAKRKGGFSWDQNGYVWAITYKPVS